MGDLTPRHINDPAYWERDDDHPLGVIANLAAQINRERQYGFPDYGTSSMPRSNTFRTPQGANRDYRPENESGSLRGSRTSGQDGGSSVGAQLIIECILGQPYTSLLPYPKPALTGLGSSMGYGLRTHPHIYMKGVKICREFYRLHDANSQWRAGNYIMHYCLIQMNKDKSRFETSSEEPPSGSSGTIIFDKFFRDYSESDETYRPFLDLELWPQGESDFKHYKNCNAINPDNGCFKLLMRKRFVLPPPTPVAAFSSAGKFQSGGRVVRMYKPLKHKVTWENKDEIGTPERPIYELWWGYTEHPGTHRQVVAGTHYKTCATNTVYFKDIGNA